MSSGRGHKSRSIGFKKQEFVVSWKYPLKGIPGIPQFLTVCSCTPLKSSKEQKRNGRLEDDFPLKKGGFSGSMLVFGGGKFSCKFSLVAASSPFSSCSEPKHTQRMLSAKMHRTDSHA